MTSAWGTAKANERDSNTQLRWYRWHRLEGLHCFIHMHCAYFFFKCELFKRTSKNHLELNNAGIVMVKCLVEYSKNGPLLFLYFVLTGIFLWTYGAHHFSAPEHTQTPKYTRAIPKVFLTYFMYILWNDRQNKRSIYVW